MLGEAECHIFGFLGLDCCFSSECHEVRLAFVRKLQNVMDRPDCEPRFQLITLDGPCLGLILNLTVDTARNGDGAIRLEPIALPLFALITWSQIGCERFQHPLPCACAC